jgi:hypothetical protein
MSFKFSTADMAEFSKGKAYVTGRNDATVRIRLPDGTETALCTITYSYDMSAQLKAAVSARIVAAWNANR